MKWCKRKHYKMMRKAEYEVANKVSFGTGTIGITLPWIIVQTIYENRFNIDQYGNPKYKKFIQWVEPEEYKRDVRRYRWEVAPTFEGNHCSSLDNFPPLKRHFLPEVWDLF